MRPQPSLPHLGPQWNAALSTHHRIAWLARESSKPSRDMIERWTVQASAAWSREHLEDDAPRVQAKLLKAFAEITGIRAEPAHAKCTAGAMPKPKRRWAKPSVGFEAWASAFAATGAWATGSKTPLSLVWNSR
jgi:renalase